MRALTLPLLALLVTPATAHADGEAPGCAGSEEAGGSPASAETRPIVIRTARGTVHGVLHPVPSARAAVLMIGGAGGGIDGPARLYPALGDRLQQEGIAALRLDYRRPGDFEQSRYDVHAALRTLKRSGVERVLLLGWSFGGAVAVSVGTSSTLVVGVATFASQSHGTEAVARLAPRSLLLFHGTADPVLGDWNSRLIYARAGEPKELVLFPEEGHALLHQREALLAKLLTWGIPLLRPRAPGPTNTRAPGPPSDARSDIGHERGRA